MCIRDRGIALKKGEILAILGENGAGKSTLMKILSGIYPAGSYSGTIAICGKEKTFRSPRDAQNAGIAMIYQEINLELDLTVAENIFVGHLPRTSRGLVDWKRMKRESETVLKTLGIDLDAVSYTHLDVYKRQGKILILYAIRIPTRENWMSKPDGV